ncbi:hypothetical protein PIB30_055242, partial [Stylosanthes scabra]|nr:hypothetical protein [Stylosanthes scabra]
MPGEWDLDNVLLNWGRNEPDWALLDPTNDHLQQKSRLDITFPLHRAPCNFQSWGRRWISVASGMEIKRGHHSNSLTYTVSDLRLY